jgi:hypothetical protein
VPILASSKILTTATSGNVSGLYLRETCDDIWVIDCSPEGHQPEVKTRIFQGVQQPVCIVMASRSGKKTETLAAVHFQSLPRGKREEKFHALANTRLKDKAWVSCPVEARAPFLPASTGAWSDYPKLEDFFLYNGSGVQTKRTWVIAPDSGSLSRRWTKLITSSNENKEELFHPTLRDGLPADRHIRFVVKEPIPGYAVNLTRIMDEKSPVVSPVRYGFPPDARVITQPNAKLWQSSSLNPLFLTAFCAHVPTSGPAITFTGLTPDLHHYKGSFGGRVFPLWANETSPESNIRQQILELLGKHYGLVVSPEDLLSYIAAIAAHPGYLTRFSEDLSTPGLRIPITSEVVLYRRAVEIGTKVLWLHTFGERMVDAVRDRPAQPPRLPVEQRPVIPKEGAISQAPEDMPDTLGYDAGKHRLLVGHGFIDNVTPAMWAYNVSGKQVLIQWFSYRKRNRERPIIGDRRKPSALGEIQPDHWLPEYTTELLNVLNVLGLLIDLEPQQAELLERICSGPLISAEDLTAAAEDSVLAKPKRTKKRVDSQTAPLFS